MKHRHHQRDDARQVVGAGVCRLPTRGNLGFDKPLAFSLPSHPRRLQQHSPCSAIGSARALQTHGTALVKYDVPVHTAAVYASWETMQFSTSLPPLARHKGAVQCQSMPKQTVPHWANVTRLGLSHHALKTSEAAGP